MYQYNENENNNNDIFGKAILGLGVALVAGIIVGLKKLFDYLFY